MLHFFRKIRRDLIENSKFYRYFKYALGEIVLVVIGILIALFINKWNDQRNDQEKLIQIFTEIRSDLLKDILRTDEILTWYVERDSLIYLVLKDSLTKEDYENNYKLKFLLNYKAFYIHDNGFNKLMNNIDHVNPSLQPLIDRIVNLYVVEKNRIVRYNNRIADESLYNLRVLGETQKWFYQQQFGLTAEMINYYLNDPYYKNRVDQFHIALYNMRYLEFRSDACLIYADLSELIGRPMELPMHLINVIHDPDNLKNYMGIYKPIDSTLPYIREIISEKHDIYIKYPTREHYIFQISRDTFGINERPNYFIAFKRDNNDEIVGFEDIDRKRIVDWIKIE